jgi:dTDP-4-dehydrorhamnose 3,5-epimerase
MTKRFEFEDTPLQGLKILARTVSSDQRGAFERLFCQEELETLLAGRRVAQINLSSTHQVGTVRGLHFQYPPYAETKIITCLRGDVFDVAVDIRRSSKTFLNWFGVKLSAESNSSILIPEGFAHGFQVLSPNSQLLYLHSTPYAPKDQGVINALDPKLNISWPLPIAQRSERDHSQPLLDQSFSGLILTGTDPIEIGGIQ